MDLNNNYTVYVHKFPNDKYYVGITRQLPEQRWLNGWGYHKQPVYSAILEFGWDNIEHIIVKQNLTAEEAKKIEIDLIFQLDSIEHGYNEDTGGGLGGDAWCEFEYNGNIYSAEELAALSTIDNMTAHDITTRINHHGWSIEKALNTPKTIKNYRFEYNGESIKELYDIRINKDLTYNQIKNRLLKYGWDIERAISQSSDKKLQPKGVGTCEFEYDGKIYNSWELCQISKIEGLTPQHITDRVNRRKWSVERAITQPLRKSKKNNL